MTGSEERLKYLLEQYAANQSTEDEVKEFFTFINKSDDDESVRLLLSQLVESTDIPLTYDMERWDKVLQKALKPVSPEVITMYPKKSFNLARVAAAAIIIVLLSVGGYLYVKQSPQKQIAQTEQKEIKNDIAPGGNKAILTLSNGTQIILDSAANGTLTQQGNTKIIKLDSGQIAYN